MRTGAGGLAFSGEALGGFKQFFTIAAEIQILDAQLIVNVLQFMLGLLEAGTFGGLDVAGRQVSGNGGRTGKNMLAHAVAICCAVWLRALVGKNDLR